MGIRKILGFTAGLSSILFLLMLMGFARLLQVTVPEPGGWFTSPGPDAIVVPWDAALSFALLSSMLGAAVIYALLMSFCYHRNAIQRHLLNGRLADAWRLAVEHGEFDALQVYLETKLQLPQPKLRPSILGAFEHLRRLAASAADESNKALTPDLRRYARQRWQKGLTVLGQTVERLALLERQQINPEKLRGRLDGVQLSIDKLAEATEAARIQLANLSLGPERDDQAEEANLAMRQIELVAEELHKFDNVISSRGDISDLAPPSTMMRE
jgi:hypothetical protein